MLLPSDERMLNRIQTSCLPWISEGQPKEDDYAPLTLRMTALKVNMFMKVYSSLGYFHKSQDAHLERITFKTRIPVASDMFDKSL